MEIETISVLGAVAVILILTRTSIDLVMFLLKRTETMIVSFGWPVNKFWMNSIFWVVLNMFILTIIVIWYEPGFWYALNLGIVPFGWAYTLLKHNDRTKWMVYDAVSWVVVGISGFVVYVFW